MCSFRRGSSRLSGKPTMMYIKADTTYMVRNISIQYQYLNDYLNRVKRVFESKCPTVKLDQNVIKTEINMIMAPVIQAHLDKTILSNEIFQLNQKIIKGKTMFKTKLHLHTSL